MLDRRVAGSKRHRGICSSAAGVRSHRFAYLIKELLNTVETSRDKRGLLQVAGSLDLVAGLGYRFGSHLSGTTFNCVGFSTDVRETGGCQGPTHLPNASIGISAKSIDQFAY